MADNHGHQRLLVQLLNGQVGAAFPGPERHLHAFTQQRSPCRGNGAGGRLPPIALTLGGGLPQRRAPVGEPAPAIPVAPAKLSHPHRSPRRPHGEVPDLTYSDETGFAEQQDLMIKALGPSPEAVVARSGKILEATPRRAQRRPLGPHDAAGAQTITDGSFVRIKGDDAAAPGLGSSRGSCPAIAVVASRLPDMCE
jgi:hypothetical protein